MVSDNNLLLPPPYTEISRSANTNIITTLERFSYQDTDLLSLLSKSESVAAASLIHFYHYSMMKEIGRYLSDKCDVMCVLVCLISE